MSDFLSKFYGAGGGRPSNPNLALTPDWTAGDEGNAVGGIGNFGPMGEDILWSAPLRATVTPGDTLTTPAGDYLVVETESGLALKPQAGAMRTLSSTVQNITNGMHHLGVNPATGEVWYQSARVNGGFFSTNGPASESHSDTPLSDLRISVAPGDESEGSSVAGDTSSVGSDAIAAAQSGVSATESTTQEPVDFDESVNVDGSAAEETLLDAATTLAGAEFSELLFKSGTELRHQLQELMVGLGGDMAEAAEAELMQDLALYTAASRVRAALLAPEGSTRTSVEDYEQLGFVGVAEHNLSLADALVSQALLQGDGVEGLAAKVATSLSHFESLREWALQSGDSERVAVTVGEDPASQLSKIADKLDGLFADSDYDDVLVDFLTQEISRDDGRYVFVSFEVEEGSRLLSSVELPSAQLAELLSVGSILIEGRDAEGRWLELSEVLAVEGDSGVIALDSIYQGFSGFRISASSAVSAELRASLTDTTVWFETQALEATALSAPLSGVEHLTELTPTVAAQLLSWIDAKDWNDYSALNQVLPAFNALKGGYESFYEGTPDATALRAMLRLSLSLASTEDSAFSTLLASAGSFTWSDVEALTGVELGLDADVEVLLSELSVAYESEEGIDAVVSELHRKAWLAESESLLDVGFDELATRIFALSNDDMEDAGVQREVARMGSVMKFKQILDGSEVELTVDDVAHFGLGELGEEQLKAFAAYLPSQASSLRADEMDLHDVFDRFIADQSQAQIALESLLAGPNWVEREVAINDSDSLSRLMNLLLAEYSDNSAAYNDLVTAVLGAAPSTERVLATIAFESGPSDYVELLDASGERLISATGISIRAYRDGGDAEGELLNLTPVANEEGRFILPSGDYSHIDLIATDYSSSVLDLASVRVMGREHALTAEHLAALGYHDLDADDISRLYQLASLAIKHNDQLEIDELLGMYQQLKSLGDWQDSPSFEQAATWPQLNVGLGENMLAGLSQWFESLDSVNSQINEYSDRVFEASESDAMSRPLGLVEAISDLADDSDFALFDIATDLPIWDFLGEEWLETLVAGSGDGSSERLSDSDTHSSDGEAAAVPPLDWDALLSQLPQNDVFS